MTRPSLSSDERSECLEVDQRGPQDRSQESLDLGVELDQLGGKYLKQIGRRTLALEAVEVWQNQNDLCPAYFKNKSLLVAYYNL